MDAAARDLDKAARCGEPSYSWRAGQERRMSMVIAAAGDRLRGQILDNGCGVGAYLERISEFTSAAFGLEFERQRASQAAARNRGRVLVATCENLPYRSGVFDLILSHEVLEHVQDDRRAAEEMVRVLRRPHPGTGQPGGRMVVFVPNRGYPFETHGVYWRGRYRFGNIPLINYLPRRLRDRLAPHVRAYRPADLQRLFGDLPVRIVLRKTLFGAYDNLIARWGVFGRMLRRLAQVLETTPLRILGLSHLWVLERKES